MPTYAGNLIGRTGDDGSKATGVAANYRRIIAPFSNFGTRQLAFFKVVLTGTPLNNQSGGADASVNENTQGQEYAISAANGDIVVPSAYVYSPDSNFAAAVNGVQIAAELAYVGTPVFVNADGNTSGATCTFVVGVYVDTAASANADMQAAVVANVAAQTIATAVDKAVTSALTVTVTAVYHNGGSLTVGAAY